MSKVFKAIEDLEKEVQRVLAGTYDDPALTQFEEAFIENLIRVAGEVSDQSAVRDVVEAALRDSADFINEDLLTNIQSNFNEIVDTATDFYTSVGVVMPNITEAITNTRAAKALRKSFESNFGSVKQELFDATVQAFEKQLAEGSLNRALLEEAILDVIKKPMHYARTNARLAVSGYNRIWRDGVAREVGLDWALYYGDARVNTRPFCLRCIGKVFSRLEIEQMSNGQGLDVVHYAGGYNCIHSWLWVDPAWDEELEAAKYNGKIESVDGLSVPE